jgi:uncharacterized protein (DUF302 family)
VTEPLSFEVVLNRTYDEALDLVAAALKTEGFGVLTKIDVRATLKAKLDEDFRPYAILGTCNPPLAHRALSHEPEAGMMLPCNVTVEADPDENGGSIVRIINPVAMLAGGGMDRDPVLGEVADQARSRLQRVAQALASID